MKRAKETETWTLFKTLEELLASQGERLHRLLLLHSASIPGCPEPRPALVEIDGAGRVTAIRRIRGDWA